MMANYTDTTGWPTPEQIRERHVNGESFNKIARTLGVTAQTLKRYLNGTLPVKPEPRDEVENDPDTIKQRDDLFVEKMRAAITSGCEQASVGIKVDRTVSNRWRHAPARVLRFSGCASPAAMCVS